jgi:single-strand DNA-binding protein
MSSLNQATIIGRLGQDPTVRYMPDGTAVTTLSVATSESWKDKATGEKKEAVEWHRISLFGRTAEVAGEYLSKGDMALFQGKIKTRKFVNKDGHEQYTTEIHAQEIKMLQTGGRDDGGERTERQSRDRDNYAEQRGMAPAPRPAPTTRMQQAAPPAPAPRQAARSAVPFDDMDDDVPF